MPRLPAICRTCGTVFPSGYRLNNVREATFAGSTSGPCPNCGGTGEVPDGIYEVVGETINVAATSVRSADQFRRIEAVLAEAFETEATPESVVAAVERESPEMGAALRKLIVPRNPTEFWAVVAALLIAIGLLLQVTSPEPPSAEEISRITDTAIEKAMHEHKKPPPEGESGGTKRQR